MVDVVEHSELTALLAWWREAGVDIGLEDAPIDWTARGESAPGADFAWPTTASTSAVGQPEVVVPAVQAAPGRSAGTSAVRAPPRPAEPATPPRATVGDAGVSPGTSAVRLPASIAATAARQTAARASTLAELEAMLHRFDGCPLKATAKNLCFFRGNPQGRLMIIGEAPGREEDLEGRPFVGHAGRLLDRMLAAIGLSEADVHITNVVYWRPPGNRTPTLEEVETCRPFLERQIELVAPQLVMTLGGPAAKAILGATDGILRVRGKWGDVAAGERRIEVMPTLHPAYLLRTPAAKRQAWRDLLAVKLALEAGNGENRR